MAEEKPEEKKQESSGFSWGAFVAGVFGTVIAGVIVNEISASRRRRQNLEDLVEE